MKINSKTARTVADKSSEEFIDVSGIVCNSKIYVIPSHTRKYIGPVRYVHHDNEELEVAYAIPIFHDGTWGNNVYSGVIMNGTTWDYLANHDAIRQATKEERNRYVERVMDSSYKDRVNDQFRDYIDDWRR